MEEELDEIPPTVEAAIEHATAASVALGPIGDRDSHASTLSFVDKRIRIVTSVREKSATLSVRQQLVRHLHFM
jgi:hypothetical protein